jgi:hypothetical protein
LLREWKDKPGSGGKFLLIIYPIGIVIIIQNI